MANTKCTDSKLAERFFQLLQIGSTQLKNPVKIAGLSFHQLTQLVDFFTFFETHVKNPPQELSCGKNLTMSLKVDVDEKSGNLDAILSMNGLSSQKDVKIVDSSELEPFIEGFVEEGIIISYEGIEKYLKSLLEGDEIDLLSMELPPETFDSKERKKREIIKKILGYLFEPKTKNPKELKKMIENFIKVKKQQIYVKKK